VLVDDGTVRPVSPATLFFAITSGSAAMFSNDALTTRLFGAKPLRPSNHAKHAHDFADLVLDGLRTTPDDFDWLRLNESGAPCTSFYRRAA
jgi:hypothetical protein